MVCSLCPTDLSASALKSPASQKRVHLETCVLASDNIGNVIIR